jgi:quinoprotein glucose dehydrogenase
MLMTFSYRDRGRFAPVVLAMAMLWAVAAAAGGLQAPAPRSVWDGIYSDAQAVRGKAAYQQECASCHLDTLGGADMAPGLVGEAFLKTWNDLTVGELFERVRISMPQDKPAALPRQQYTDIVAYMLQVNHFPVGENELSPDLSAMNAIKILTTKPARAR